MNSIEGFSIGDVVVLKNDPSIRMTVEGFLNAPNYVQVVWFDIKRQLRRANVKPETLKVV